MAKKANTRPNFDDMFASTPIIPSKTPSEPITPTPDELVKPNKVEPTNANKRGRKAKTQSTDPSEGKKTVTVYLNADNWAKFCLIAQIKKPSASAWLDELINEEISKNKDVLDLVEKIK